MTSAAPDDGGDVRRATTGDDVVEERDRTLHVVLHLDRLEDLFEVPATTRPLWRTDPSDHDRSRRQSAGGRSVAERYWRGAGLSPGSGACVGRA
ncbi:hypothetical protein [Dermatobacter hominis]|uniref:hypothetical protein n=1 Tax=Dermatobacter hominis TaxID=2884263 RepID=UPI001D120091|nr:hypothetical protein [Dermatobacter hominis]UDY34670.1 hypothetical protein LH044_15175 [Dermatobacter hominis]